MLSPGAWTDSETCEMPPPSLRFPHPSNASEACQPNDLRRSEVSEKLLRVGQLHAADEDGHGCVEFVEGRKRGGDADVAV